MANFVVKTIWQSKEINEAGDTPIGIESRAQGIKDQLGKPTSIKGFPKKKKAVSFHGKILKKRMGSQLQTILDKVDNSIFPSSFLRSGCGAEAVPVVLVGCMDHVLVDLDVSVRVEPQFTSESPNLNLKRSSACTNVSLLNLTDGERDDSTTENESTDDGSPPGGAGGERRDPLFPIKPAWSEDEDDIFNQQQEVSNSGLLRAKDSITSLKEKTSKVTYHLQNLQESCRKVTKSVEDAEIKTSVLEENSALLEEKLRNLQQQVQVEDFRWKSMLELAQKEVLRLLAQLGLCLEGVLPQRERVQVEQGQELRMLREELDEVSAAAKRASVSLTQVRADLDGLLEDISRHLATLKNMEASDRLPSNCARCSSIVNTEVLRKMFEHAMAPILEELKQRTPSEGICPNCQRLQKMMTQ
ncbi:testis-specific serine kinase substrate-like [Erythrolamprus reginae]|uniref:testis-specific serine kinase substrate-like n=1 Tax=Erythrolamprus reginae TaxID=121349 RepID=UPI00396CB1AB